MFTPITPTATDFLIYIGIALGVFLLLTGVTQIASRRENAQEARNRRMKMIAAGARTEDILSVLKPELQRGPFSRLPLVGDLPRLIRRAALNVSPGRFLMMCSLISVAVMIPAIVFLPLPLGVVAGLLLGFGLPIYFLVRKASARADRMTRQLPDALDLLARGLRVGHPLQTSIKAVATDIPDPIGSEFGIMFDQVSYGDDIADAFHEFAERVDLEDVRYLAVSIGIQHGTGGDLARVVQVLGQVVRNRIAMRQRILAISSEGRLTGAFLSLLPVLIFVATSILTPDYYSGVMDDPMFTPIAIAVVALTVLNFIAIRKLVNFRI